LAELSSMVSQLDSMVSDRKGSVLRIERNSIHDGQGLRVVLFLKGCPLSCSWCSTPESQKTVSEKGYNSERCDGCGSCIDSCPEGALSFSDKYAPGQLIRNMGCP